jgi:predicted PurR-regulated permease PerM
MVKVKPASHYVLQFGFYGLVFLVVAGILFSFTFIFITLFISVVCALLLEPLVNYWETRGIHRVLVILGIYVCIAAGLTLLSIFLLPQFVYEVKHFLANLPAYGASIHGLADKLQATIKAQAPGFSLPDYYPYLRGKLLGSLQTVMASAPALITSAASLMSMALLVPFITFFLLADGHLISKHILSLVPNRYFEMWVLLLHKTVDALKQYIRGQMIDAVAIMILTMAGYAIIGLPYFVVVGLIAGLANVIPYFGPIISFCSAIFVLSMTPGLLTPWSFLAVSVVFVAVQLIDSLLIYPTVVGKTVNLHPLVVILGIAVGGNMGGIIGMLVAVPLISIGKVTIEVLHTYLKSYSII